MKKIFTLVSVALVAMTMNAQTESWYVNNEDGTLKADYVANADASQASVVEFSTTNVKGTHVSGPVDKYQDGPLVDGKLDPIYNNGWSNITKKDLSADGSVAPFYYVQGKGNPVNINKVSFEEVVTDGVGTGNYRAYWEDAYYNPDGTAGLPSNGTYATLTPSVNGTLKVAVWINKGSRDIYVVKGSDAKALALGTDVIASGYVNGQNNDVAEDSPLSGYPAFQENIAPKGTEGNDAYIVGSGGAVSWVYLTFAATAGETYYVFNKNTQIGFGGFEFTADEGTGIAGVEVEEENDPNAPVYNLAGQRVGKDVKGILIQNGKKFIRK